MGLMDSLRGFIGLEPRDTDEYYDEEETYEEEEEKKPRASSKKRRDYGNDSDKVVSINSRVAGSTIKLIQPDSYQMSPVIADEIKARKMVIVNLQKLDSTNPVEAQKVIDFISGAAYAVDGAVTTLSDGVVIATPSNIRVEDSGSGRRTGRKTGTGYERF